MEGLIKDFTKNDKLIKIQLRLAKKEDLEDIWVNFNEVVREGIYIPVKSEVKTTYEKNSWFANHELEKNVIAVAIDISNDKKGSTVIGQCVIEHLTWEAAEHVGELGIIINSKYRNIGIGREIIKFSIDEAKKRDFKKIILAVFHTNEGAIHLYESLRFKKIGVRKNQYFLKNVYYHEVLMDYFISE